MAVRYGTLIDSAPVNIGGPPSNLKKAGVFLALHISIRKSGDVTILDLSGRLTIDGESELLEEHLETLIAADARKVLLNLAELKQIDSSGIGVIVARCTGLRRKDGDLKLLNPTRHVLEVMKALHLLEAISGFTDEPQALASFRSFGYAAKP
jgi:anti-sigma B factor antagonist